MPSTEQEVKLLGTDPARTLFDKFVKRGYGRIKEAVETNESEGQYLDFKGFTDPSSMRRVFGKIGSAFANSGGGVIVWGVDARRPNNAKDSDPQQAVAEVPTNRLADMEVLVNDMAWQALDRPVSGVTSHRIRKPGSKDTGFLVTLVPESEYVPHQSAPEQKYYYRSGSSTIPMGHKLVEALVMARSGPRIVLKLDQAAVASQGYNRSKVVHWIMQIQAHNVGRAPARSVDFAIRCRPGYIALNKAEMGVTDNTIIDGERGGLVRFKRDFILYPGTESAMCQIALPGREDFTMTAKIVCDFFAEDYLARFTIDLDEDHFHAGLRRESQGYPYQDFHAYRTVEPD